MKIVTVKNLGSIPYGTEGKVIARYTQWGYKYIVVLFDTGETREFSEKSHPLISYKGCIKFVE